VDVEILDVTDDEARVLLLSEGPLAALAQTQDQLRQRLLELAPPVPADLQAAWQEAAEEALQIAADPQPPSTAIYYNHAIPSAVISPDEVLGEEERDRLEAQWNARFRRGGAGRVLVGEAGMRVQVLSHSMGDLAALADLAATKEDICSAFHCPVAFFTRETNLANLQAADAQHLSKCIHPRLTRRDEKLNEQLVPLYDPTGRLFLASDDPTPVDQDLTIKQQASAGAAQWQSAPSWCLLRLACRREVWFDGANGVRLVPCPGAAYASREKRRRLDG
jgi:hypothetical protein